MLYALRFVVALWKKRLLLGFQLTLKPLLSQTVFSCQAQFLPSFTRLSQVLMTRDSDVRLELGFHCVVNRSQKNIVEGLSREDLWAKERDIFTKNDRVKRLPEKNWGTLRLMEKVAKIQEARVDECLPKIKEAVRKKTGELREELGRLPDIAKTEDEQFRLFNEVLAKIRDDLARRVRAEFISGDNGDRELTIAPVVAVVLQNFKRQLVEKNPNWLGKDMIDRVTDVVQTFTTGYTVDNLTVPQVFINLIKQVFVEDELLKDSVHELVMDVEAHLQKVVTHIVAVHANINHVLLNHLHAVAEECIEQLAMEAEAVCQKLAKAQQVTSTTHGQYMEKLTKFRTSWFQDVADPTAPSAKPVVDAAKPEEEFPQDFKKQVKDAVKEKPLKLAVLEICSSLHVFAGFMIDGFAEMVAKLVKFYMVEQLADKLEETFRSQLGRTLHELFPKDDPMVYRYEDLSQKIKELSDFKASTRVMSGHGCQSWLVL